jgi:hypothetical protein
MVAAAMNVGIDVAVFGASAPIASARSPSMAFRGTVTSRMSTNPGSSSVGG